MAGPTPDSPRAWEGTGEWKHPEPWLSQRLGQVPIGALGVTDAVPAAARGGGSAVPTVARDLAADTVLSQRVQPAQAGCALAAPSVSEAGLQPRTHGDRSRP